MTISRRSVLGAGLAGPLLASPFLIRPASAQRAAGIIRYGLSAFPPNLQPWVSTGASAGGVSLTFLEQPTATAEASTARVRKRPTCESETVIGISSSWMR